VRNQAPLCIAAATALLSLCTPAQALFTARRLISGLNQPTAVVQAPGDSQHLFILQRSGTNNTVGDILRYDLTNNSSSSFLNIGGSLVQDGGLLSMAFHPDYETNGLFYVSALVGPTNKLFEYRTPTGGGTPTLQRTLLSYDNPRTQHTIDWIGFKPGAEGEERHQLYVTTGDGGIQANEATFTNRAQDPSLVFGKVLRLNVNPAAPDAYPDDPNKNFAIPPGNPFVGASNGALGEILATGLRNPWRAGFDRDTGDLYVGDVGFDSKEEVNFLKNDGSFASGRDFGWAKREGTLPNPVAAHAGAKGDSLDPVYQIDHSANFSSITGGFVYRGPIVDLQGKYLFADFVSHKIMALAFDRDTDPATFNGSSAGVIAVQDLTTQINALINLNGGGGPVRNITSFGEDHAGNLYLVSFGNGFFPPLGTGAIYTLTANDVPTWTSPTDGSWGDAANWSTNSSPNGFTSDALLAGPAGSGTRVVTLTAPVSLQRLTFDNASVSYEVSGSSSLTITANPVADAIVVGSGSHSIAAPMTFTTNTRINIASGSTLTVTSPISAAGRVVFKRGGGSLATPATDVQRLIVEDGQLRFTGTGNSTMSALKIEDGAELDLTSSTLILDYAQSEPQLAALRTAILSARLTSSISDFDSIGILDTALTPLTSFNGATNLDESTLIVRATLSGDTNLDRLVNFDDLLVLAQNYGESDMTWQLGDFNHDQMVDFDDLLSLAQNYGESTVLSDLSSLPLSFSSDWVLAQSLVPEPATFVVGTSVSLLCGRRTRTRIVQQTD
jgi:hypothetical protein